jgi:glycosyltransferase involved in cell wall biosynthesis
MRVVMITPYAPLTDGLADYAAFLVTGLRSAGNDVWVVSSRHDPGAPAEVIASVPRTPVDVAAAQAAIVRRQPDVVHLQFCVAAYAAGVPALVRLIAALRRTGVRIVTTLHDLSRDVAMLRAPGRALYRRLAAMSDVVVVHTNTARELLGRLVGARRTEVAVISYPRTPLPPATTGPQELARRFGLSGKRVLLAFGFIYVEKGLDDLVRALHALRRQHADVSVVVAGAVRVRRGPFRIFELRDRAYLLRVRRLIRRLGLSDAVVFAGYVPDGEVRGWFELAEAAVLPYRRIEQSSVASLARSAGTPIVASDVGELAAFVQRPEWCAPPRSPLLLAAALESFLAADAPAKWNASPGEDGSVADAVRATLAVYAVPQPAGT